MWRSVAALLVAVAGVALADAPSPPRGGVEFQSADIQRLQADDFGNPGLLWVQRGEALWTEQGCAGCHGDAARSLRGAAARHPRFDPELGRVVDLEGRINACVQKSPGKPALPWESDALLSLATYVARQSLGQAIVADADERMKATVERGREIYFQRQGQLNLACTQCHDGAWGRTLLAEKISQGQPADWPAYRLEWQTLGSLQRRLRACYFGVRAELPQFGSPDLVALELYLADRARGLAVNAPGVRR